MTGEIGSDTQLTAHFQGSRDLFVHPTLVCHLFTSISRESTGISGLEGTFMELELELDSL